MPKCEYYQPKLIPGERPEPGIIVDAEELHKLLLQAEMMMNKVDRIRYATRAISRIEGVIEEFVLAYDFEDDRLYHLKRMWANIAILIRLIRIIGETGAIRVQPHHRPKDPKRLETERPPMTPDRMKLEILNYVQSLDEGATKWKNSVIKHRQTKKGKTGGPGGPKPAEPEV
ncbi:MAG: hypothetical protein K6G86_07820 [Bacteroidales bacterium]|nr:hypothetical protein [Bacteroidales bacterium]